MSTTQWNRVAKARAKAILVWILLLIVAGGIRLWSIESIPPPLWRDEARNGLDILTVTEGLQYPIYFERNGGREPLFLYLQGLSIAVFGLSTFALRFPAAVTGLVTILVLYLLSRALFPQKPQMAWMAAGALATSFWHLFYSRFGLRGILVPLFVAGTVYAFWRGSHGKNRIWLVISGISLGLSMYTYISSRFLPLVFILFVLSGLLMDGSSGLKATLSAWRKHVVDAICFILPALITALPLIHYFRTHPMAGYRIGVVSAFSQGWASSETWTNLASNAWHVASMFLLRGDIDPGRNMSGRPVWDYVLGTFFVIGCVIAIGRWRHAETRLILFSLGVMLLPTILSTDAPNHLRALGALPAACLLVSMGLDWVCGQIVRRGYSLPPYAYSAITIGVLAIGGTWTVYDYFLRWAPLETTYKAFQGEAVEIVNYIETYPPDTDVYLPLRVYNNYPQISFLTLQDFPQRRSFLNLSPVEQNGIQKHEAVVLLSEDRTHVSAFVCLTHILPNEKGSTVFMPHFKNLKNEELRSALQKIDENPTEIRDRYGKLLAVAFQVGPENKPWQISATIPYTVQANLADEIELEGYDLASHQVRPGERFWLTIYWRRIGQISDNYLGFAQAIDPNWRAWGDGGNEGDKLSLLPWSFPTLFWPQSEIVPDFYEVRVARDTPPGKYHLCVGMYQGSSGERLDIVQPQESPFGGMVKIATLSIGQEDIDLQAIQNPLKATLGNSVSLLGYDLDTNRVAPGTNLKLTLYWQATGTTSADYTVFTHLLDSSKRMWSGYDSQPQAGRNPTSMWAIGEVIKDELSILIPPETPFGDYELELGMYDLRTGTRLPIELVGRGAPVEDHLRIPGIQITTNDTDRG